MRTQLLFDPFWPSFQQQKPCNLLIDNNLQKNRVGGHFNFRVDCPEASGEGTSILEWINLDWELARKRDRAEYSQQFFLIEPPESRYDNNVKKRQLRDQLR
jgi:hypothetical protein